MRAGSSEADLAIRLLAGSSVTLGPALGPRTPEPADLPRRRPRPEVAGPAGESRPGPRDRQRREDHPGRPAQLPQPYQFPEAARADLPRRARVADQYASGQPVPAGSRSRSAREDQRSDRTDREQPQGEWRGDLQTLLAAERRDDGRRPAPGGLGRVRQVKATDAELKKFAVSTRTWSIDPDQGQPHLSRASRPTRPRPRRRRSGSSCSRSSRTSRTRRRASPRRRTSSPRIRPTPRDPGGDIGYFGSRPASSRHSPTPRSRSSRVRSPTRSRPPRPPPDPGDRPQGRDPGRLRAEQAGDLPALPGRAAKADPGRRAESAEEKHAIDIQPMPPDLFPPTPSAAPAASAPSAPVGR